MKKRIAAGGAMFIDYIKPFLAEHNGTYDNRPECRISRLYHRRNET
jgi:hypothetical protein